MSQNFVQVSATHPIEQLQSLLNSIDVSTVPQYWIEHKMGCGIFAIAEEIITQMSKNLKSYKAQCRKGLSVALLNTDLNVVIPEIQCIIADYVHAFSLPWLHLFEQTSYFSEMHHKPFMDYVQIGEKHRCGLKKTIEIIKNKSNTNLDHSIAFIELKLTSNPTELYELCKERNIMAVVLWHW